MPSKISQPKLRTPLPNERVVRVAGLKFILPNNWAPGDVLDEDSAAFINAAWHTAAINGFAEIRQSLLNDPRTTYEIFDQELQTFYDSYKRTTRQLDASDAKPGRTPEEKALISYARPRFNNYMGGKKHSRAKYEELLLVFVEGNRTKLLAEMKRENKAIKDLTDRLSLLDV